MGSLSYFFSPQYEPAEDAFLKMHGGLVGRLLELIERTRAMLNGMEQYALEHGDDASVQEFFAGQAPTVRLIQPAEPPPAPSHVRIAGRDYKIEKVKQQLRQGGGDPAAYVIDHDAEAVYIAGDLHSSHIPFVVASAVAKAYDDRLSAYGTHLAESWRRFDSMLEAIEDLNPEIDAEEIAPAFRAFAELRKLGVRFDPSFILSMDELKASAEYVDADGQWREHDEVELENDDPDYDLSDELLDRDGNGEGPDLSGSAAPRFGEDASSDGEDTTTDEESLRDDDGSADNVLSYNGRSIRLDGGWGELRNVPVVSGPRLSQPILFNSRPDEAKESASLTPEQQRMVDILNAATREQLEEAAVLMDPLAREQLLHRVRLELARREAIEKENVNR